jgi:hypothetical protein
MKRIADVGGTVLEWVQPHALKREYELLAGGERIASLRFRSAFGTLATAESAEGCWTFKRVGFWQARVTVRACGSDANLAIFKPNTWSDGGTLEFPDGRRVLATTSFWQTRLEFTTEAGELLVRLHPAGLFRLSVRVELGAAHPAGLQWLVMLGCYLIVAMHDEAAGAGAVVATMS